MTAVVGKGALFADSGNRQDICEGRRVLNRPGSVACRSDTGDARGFGLAELLLEQLRTRLTAQAQVDDVDLV